ncbi:hypothetical protein [Caulobacter sp. Root1472]|uniref:hypothetical protein n=1 Tax=Caulobacter sp. Root1472 TaxID=1736470 RepID=UPI0012E3353A|nr:hypothetical protein [Caulobacter sp. Root1472]
MDNNTSKQTQVSSRARPVRTAFFVDVANTSHEIVDAIFAYGFSIWGGRFSLIVPCENGAPISEFWPWLRTYDPDQIYSYVDLDQAVQQRVHETLYPAAFQFHGREQDGRAPGLAPNPQITPLSAASVLPLAGLPGGFDGVRGIKIVGAMGTEENDRFLRDSFGYPPPQTRNAMRNILSDAASMLLVIADADLQPRPRYVHNSEATTPNVGTLLTMMADNRRILGMAQLSAMATPRLDLSSRGWTDAFNIVVGDTVADRILYWNARALMSPWRDGTDVDLCIPRAHLEDPAFMAGLRDFLNRRNHVNNNGGGGGGPSRVTLRSISLDDGELEVVAGTMRAGQSWVQFSHQSLGSLADCVPDARATEHADLMVGRPELRSTSGWTESHGLGDELRLIPPSPDHLRHAPVALIDQSIGTWAVDLDIARGIDHSPYTNVQHRWRLPRRLRVTRAFVAGYQLGGQHGAWISPRVCSGGFLTLFSAANAKLPKIILPTDLQAIRTGLESGRDWPPFERGIDQISPEQACYAAERSSAGRHFWGVYQLFGGMNAARSVLLNAFWRKQLEAYGATDQRTDARRDRVEKRLARRLGSGVLDLSDEGHLQTLADIVLQDADVVRMTLPSLDWSDFHDDFRGILARFNADNPATEDLNLEEELRLNQNALRESVQGLCERGVLHQGYEHRCEKCLHRSWLGIGDLKPRIICEVCHGDQPAPIDRPWQFRLNGFLREALQRHGVGPLFWALGRLQRHNQNSFWFEGPLNIYFDEVSFETRRPQTDIDLTIIDNGQVLMCEVKQSTRQFKDPQGLARTMSRLRPDIAMIAVMEPLSPALTTKFAAFSTALDGTGIKPELMTLDAETDIDASPYL